MHSPQHFRLDLTSLCCLCPPWVLPYSLDYSTFASLEIPSSRKATGSSRCADAALAELGRWPATGFAHCPARDRRPRTCERPCQACLGVAAVFKGRDVQPSRGRGRGRGHRRYEALVKERGSGAGIVPQGYAHCMGKRVPIPRYSFCVALVFAQCPRLIPWTCG